MTVERIMAMAARYFGKDATGWTAASDLFDTLGIDSVQALELLTELEAEFDVEIPDYELRDVRTFEALAAVIERRR